MEDYYIGLDIGDASVGYAVIGKDYHLVKNHSKNMWGARLFEPGKTAKERRLFRSSRRHYERRRKRIALLQRMFEEEILKVDATFFLRLKESFCWKEDSHYKKDYNLFIDSSYNDKIYYKEYPTIYHLRHKLMYSKEKMDIRLVYLGIHHILKYRGNFLYEGQNFDVKSLDVPSKIKSVLNIFAENFEMVDLTQMDQIDFSALENLFINKQISLKQKQEEIQELLKKCFFNSNQLKQFCLLLLGKKANLTVLFSLEGEKVEVNFSSSKYEEERENISLILGEKMDYVEQLFELYSNLFYKSMFSSDSSKVVTCLSEAMLQVYTKHEKDLKLLKKLLKEQDPTLYSSFFREKGDNSYESYIHNSSKFDYDALKKYLKKILSSISSPVVDQILEDIEKDNFLRKINVVQNSLYPYQVHLQELRQILYNQGQYYPFLLEKYDEKTTKIEQLFIFRIPYYVGPLNLNADENGNSRSFAWLTKRENEKITPFNFHQVVDVEKTAENFILRMTNFCTYLLTEKVIPKNSLLYTEFMVLNELKQIRVNGHKLPLVLQQKAIKELFLKQRVIKDSTFKKWLIKQNEYPFLNGNLEIKGYQKEDQFASSMGVFIDFIDIFGEITFQNQKMIEKLIEWITIFEDKKVLKQKIARSYPSLTEEILKKIISKKYQGWSRLSFELLTGTTGICYIDSFGEMFSIMDLLRTTEENFMQILCNKKYGFEEKIYHYNYKEEKSEITLEDVLRIPTSPSVKKGIWQSVCLTSELVSFMGYPPKHIFIEVARSDEKKKRTMSRIDKIRKQYLQMEKSLKEQIEYKKLMGELENYDVLDERVYLYFMQFGKCLYSSKPLNIHDLSSYEIDHIIPRSLIKDDSFDNLALVYKEMNQCKKADLTLKTSIIEKQKSFWKLLQDHDFMSSKKYFNLCRKEFRAEDIEGFINRQLVETRQIVQHVIHLFNSIYKEDTVVSVKASLSSDYRKRYQLYKFRELNHFHHAQDAYLAACLGLYILVRYPKLKNEFIYNLYLQKKIVFSNNSNRYGFILDGMEKDYEDKERSVYLNMQNFHDCVKKTIYQNDPLITRKCEFYSGAFYNQTLYKKGSSSSLVEKKKGLDPLKYGGYTGIQEAYSMLISYVKRGKTVKKMIGIPALLDSMERNGQNVLKEYICKKEGIDHFTILKKYIGRHQAIFYKGQLCYLSSSSEVFNGVEFTLDYAHMEKFKDTFNLIYNQAKGTLDEHLVDELVDYILGKMKIAYPLYQSEREKLELFIKEGYYINLRLEEKIRLIRQLFICLSASPSRADLKFLNEKQSSIKFSDAIGRRSGQNIGTGKFIYTSLSGLRRNTYEF